MIVAGDFNDSFNKMEKLSSKLNMNSVNLGPTRKIEYGNDIRSSRIDGIWSTEEIIEEHQN
jgi:endonuclease/exonuclease/phosphatase (EEP) superfamily protein YafD